MFIILVITAMYWWANRKPKEAIYEPAPENDAQQFKKDEEASIKSADFQSSDDTRQLEPYDPYPRKSADDVRQVELYRLQLANLYT